MKVYGAKKKKIKSKCKILFNTDFRYLIADSNNESLLLYLQNWKSYYILNVIFQIISEQLIEVDIGEIFVITLLLLPLGDEILHTYVKR